MIAHSITKKQESDTYVLERRLTINFLIAKKGLVSEDQKGAKQRAMAMNLIKLS